MCQADTTVETKNDELGGVTGFGTEHRCVDWEVLIGWVSQWENYGQEKGSVSDTPEHHLHDIEHSQSRK